MAHVSAEDLYLDLYDALVDDAEYLQADSSGRNFLNDMIIVGTLSSVLTMFANGFFSRFGERVADGIADKVNRLLKRSSRDDLVEALTLLQPYLPLLQEGVQSGQRAEEARIAELLCSRGMPLSTAQQVAGKILDTLRNAGNELNRVPDGRSAVRSKKILD